MSFPDCFEPPLHLAAPLDRGFPSLLRFFPFSLLHLAVGLKYIFDERGLDVQQFRKLFLQFGGIHFVVAPSRHYHFGLIQH